MNWGLLRAPLVPRRLGAAPLIAVLEFACSPAGLVPWRRARLVRVPPLETSPARVAIVLLVAGIDPPVQAALRTALGAGRRTQRPPRPVRWPPLVRRVTHRRPVGATLRCRRARELSKHGLPARAAAVELLASSRVLALHDEATLLRRRGVQMHRLHRLLDSACETRA